MLYIRTQGDELAGVLPPHDAIDEGRVDRSAPAVEIDPDIVEFGAHLLRQRDQAGAFRYDF